MLNVFICRYISVADGAKNEIRNQKKHFCFGNICSFRFAGFIFCLLLECGNWMSSSHCQKKLKKTCSESPSRADIIFSSLVYLTLVSRLALVQFSFSVFHDVDKSIHSFVIHRKNELIHCFLVVLVIVNRKSLGSFSSNIYFAFLIYFWHCVFSADDWLVAVPMANVSICKQLTVYKSC